MRLWALWATRSVVPKSTARAFGFSQAVVLVGDGAEHDRAITNDPADGVLDKTDRLTDQGLVDVDRAIAPSDVAVMAHPPDVVFPAIFRRAQDAVEASR